MYGDINQSQGSGAEEEGSEVWNQREPDKNIDQHQVIVEMIVFIRWKVIHPLVEFGEMH